MDTAIPCGLLVTELVTNALKYAFASPPLGRAVGGNEIRVALHVEGKRCTLTVSDNGAGLPAGLDARAARSFGLRLVGILAGQLEGQLDIETQPGQGATFRVTFDEAQSRY